MFTVIALIGCGNSCFVGFFNGGNGSVIVQTGNSPPVCSLTQANGAIGVIMLKSPVCETCTAAARVQHVFVTLRSIQLRQSAMDDADSAAWLEIAPQLANEPRQIDLIGNSITEILVENAIVPAGNYREVRLQFFPDSPANVERLAVENACGEKRWNCIIMADGHVEPLRLPGDVPELRITVRSLENDSFAVLPDSRMDLRLSLEPHQVAYSSSTEGWKLQSLLVGRATVIRRWPVEQENSTSN
jgi:hypothetical protein